MARGGGLSLFNRRAENVIVAAATPVDFKVPSEAERLLAREEEWQKLGVAYYDAIGELRYGLNLFANGLSKVRLYPAQEQEDGTVDAVTAEGEGADPNAERVSAVLKRLNKGPGIKEFIRKATLNLKQTGVAYLVGLEPREGGNDETWFAAALTEVKKESGKTKVKTPDGKWEDLREAPAEGVGPSPGGEMISGGDFLLKIHIPHPNDSAKADSAMRAVASTCEGIIMLDRTDRGTLLSRIMNSGIMILSDALTTGATDPTKDGSGDMEDAKDPVIKLLVDVARQNVTQDGNAQSQLPVFLRAPHDQVNDSVAHVTFDRKIDDKLEEKMQAKLRRLAQGLDVPPEFIFGLGDANHWGAGQIEESDFRIHLQPFIEMLCAALTVGYFQPALEAVGLSDPQDYLVWYDPSAVIARPNRGNDARDAFKEGGISWKAFRNELGFDDSDAPTEEELMVRIALSKGSFDPEVVRWAMQLLEDKKLTSPEDEQPGGDPPPLPPAPDNGGGGAPAEEAPEDEANPTDAPEPQASLVAAAGDEALRTLARSLAEIDRSLRERIIVSADAALERAFEKAGARVASHAKRDRGTKAALEGTKPMEVCPRLGRSLVRGLGLTEDELLSDAFASLETRFERWTEEAQERTLSLLPGLTEADIERARALFGTSRKDAWTWMSAALSDLAATKLYDPHPAAPEVGELDVAALVPFGYARVATQIAGGATGYASYADGLLDIQGNPFGGIGSGEIVTGLLSDQDIQTRGWGWIYGAYPRRSFLPHAELDGTEFSNWDDPVLTNNEGWPETPFFFPGDHTGCTCDSLMLLGDESA